MDNRTWEDLEAFEPFHALMQLLKDEIRNTRFMYDTELQAFLNGDENNERKIIAKENYIKGLEFLINQYEIWKTKKNK